MAKNAQEKEKIKWVHSLSPHTVVWEITLACNMRCIHCGSSAGPLTKRRNELDTKEALDVIKQLKEIGTQRIVLSGGEPFLRKDWDILTSEISRLGITPSFVSNGFVLDESKAEKIKRLNNPALHIGLSIDGNEKVHDYIRQTKGSFNKVTRVLEILKDNCIPASVITQVNMLNFKILPDIRDHIFKYGIYAWQIQLATPWGRLASNPKLLLGPKEYLKLVNFIVEQRKIYGEMVVGADDIGYYTELESGIRPQGEWQGCHAGLRVLGLTSNGGVTGCLSLQEPQFIEGNVRKRRLKDIWYDPALFSYNREFKEDYLQGFCRECPHRLKCRGGCKNTAYSFCGSLYENFYCVFRIMLGKTVPRGKLKLKRTAGAGKYHP